MLTCFTCHSRYRIYTVALFVVFEIGIEDAIARRARRIGAYYVAPGQEYLGTGTSVCAPTHVCSTHIPHDHHRRMQDRNGIQTKESAQLRFARRDGKSLTLFTLVIFGSDVAHCSHSLGLL